jgi:chemotaxis protein methyltransferase CheR
MTAPPTTADLVRLRDVVEQKLGLRFDDDKLPFLADVAGRRVPDLGAAALRDYVARLAERGGREELRALSGLLTVSETSFFRYADHFRVFAATCLEPRAAAAPGTPPLRVLSAGAASGEEPYTLAMLALERFGAAASQHVRIVAVDVNPVALKKAAEGRYSAWALRETPPDVRRRRFREEGREFTVDRAVRELVTFEERNLHEDDAAFWAPGAFDVVFCRNVMMYFAPEAARALIARIARAVVPGGPLFLGHAETLRGVSHAFRLAQRGEAFYYLRRSDAEDAAHEPPAEAASLVGAGFGAATGVATGLEGDAPWADEIRRASERIADLDASVASRAAASAAAAPAADLRRASELLREERFEDALSLLRAAPAPTATPEAHLLLAVLLVNKGELREAEQVCKRLLAADEFNAEAHYLSALCRERAGDPTGAVDHDRTATYLDAEFAMPRLHRGILARRLGDRDAARRELRAAADLLLRESPSRLLSFGGGFTRESLIELCRSELRAAGEAP